MPHNRVTRFGYRAVFDPAGLVETSGARTDSRVRRTGYWVLVYAASLFLTSLPAASQRAAFAPGDPATWDRFLRVTMQDFWPVLILGLLSVGVYHALLVVTFNSGGLYATFVTFVQSTGTYLAVTLGLYVFQPWARTTADVAFLGTERLLLVPEFSATAGVVANGSIALLFVSLGYYVYTLYLNARINGGAGVASAAAVSVLSAAFLFRLYYELFQLMGQVSIVGLYAPF